MTFSTKEDSRILQEKEEKKQLLLHGRKCRRSTDGLDNHRTAGEVEKNIVVSPAALATAKYLEKTFGTPYEVTYPIVEELVPDMDYRRKKILIVHQQVIGNAMRAEIRRRCQKVNGDPSVDNNAVITVASWFMMKQELSEEGDISLREEDDYMELIKKEDYDIVFADPMMKRMTEDAYKMAGTGYVADAHETERKRIFIDATHFAVSGKLREEMKKAGGVEMKETVTRRIRVYGIVQGVGFRPTVSRHATTCNIHGSVSNKGPYVEIFAQAPEAQVDRFVTMIREQSPKRAAILKMNIEDVENPEIYKDFQIVESEKTKGEIFVSPDIAICEECKEEMYQPGNRRYLHPFINCTCCGPRLTILDALPYDRERTSMKEFPMCPDCEHEYHDPEDRRFDAQPVCCNNCGPQVYLAERSERGRDAVTYARRVIAEGGICGSQRNRWVSFVL